MACRSDTAFGADTVFEVFERERARIVVLGASWDSCTQVHRYEELFDVPYRHPMTVSGHVDFGAGRHPLDLRMVVRDVDLKSTLDFAPLFDRLRVNGSIAGADLLGTRVESVSTADLAAVCGELMTDDPWILVRQPRLIERRARLLAREPVRLAVLGSRTLDVLTAELAAEGERVLAGEPLAVHAPEFGALGRDIHDPASPLRTFGAQVSFFVDRIEDVLAVDDLDPDLPAERLADAVNHYADLVAAYAETTDRPVFVTTFAQLQAARRPVGPLIAEANRLLAAALAGLETVHTVDLADAVARHGGDSLVDQRLWQVARVPHSRSLSATLARRYWGLALSVLGRTARVIVTDLDNTLWHGVVGEDGIEGIQVGTDHPGNAHQRLQRVLKSLSDAGVALAVCSKNDEDLALRAIREHSGMVLGEDDFVAMEIGWRPKTEAIADLAARLNIGLANILFLDDNPVERAAVREFLPDVIVPELPADPTGYADLVLDSPFTTVFAVTDADRRRTAQYRAREQVEKRRRGFDRPEDFYASLGTEVHVSPLTEGTMARAEQLCAKTNQFNTTTRRHTRAELRHLADAPDSDVLVVAVGDRFSPREDVGLVILRHDGPVTTVDSYLLSCRVLGRGVEAGLLGWLTGRLAADGKTRVRGLVVPTERNGPCRTVFADAGFTPGPGDGEWERPVDGAARGPAWLPIVDHTKRRETQHV
ncbi:HAD-superfamily phosphatase, subfamily IIIC/FkbH-like domain-containing protein [Actinokineospora alba]|uniref:HAD-superfamily phosphatase, subfamily IIIC/FkbH-like domain-containing protein n=1 Tax=Actinokineospora alba TaxID=504798 RepID=A0A1H0FDR0_9PSEU|nr:HAD-IIIC family phosphatase [Actinokineospora alba]TDP69437.1 HAD superfamily phosphatase (TIGR01681 family)/FkbH-like protein [Actinokineospora alba]SDI16825.1 HAD-superfamily phosphatase, subfamily IIIC/FkbH-like domain-containing protein [Actinokineospora alba]SDN92706.1 HAD-superfamily phosphatase, subfamily IIIC/FkbH-like domain-containing protein [Actinokineospora alba]